MKLKRHDIPSAAAIFEGGLSDSIRSISTQYRQRLDEKYAIPPETIRQALEDYVRTGTAVVRVERKI